MKRVFIQSAHNRPSGGGKVNHMLACLFLRNGFDAFIFSPRKEVYTPSWLRGSAPILSNDAMAEMCTSSDIVIGTWPDKEAMELVRDCPADVKIFYPQCNFFLEGETLVGDRVFNSDSGYTHFWSVSESNKNILEKKYQVQCDIVHPYFDHQYYANVRKNKERSGTLALSRKGAMYVTFIRGIFGKENIHLLSGKFTEDDFAAEASHRNLFLHTAIGYQPNLKKKLRAWGKYLLTKGCVDRRTKVTYAGSRYDEGFPLPPAEAALSGCVIVGFAKNGDWEWMNHSNSFIAKDRSYYDLYQKVRKASSLQPSVLQDMNKQAVQALKKFNAERTWKEIQSSLGTHVV